MSGPSQASIEIIKNSPARFKPVADKLALHPDFPQIMQLTRAHQYMGVKWLYEVMDEIITQEAINLEAWRVDFCRVEAT